MQKLTYWFFSLTLILAIFPLSIQAASAPPTVILDRKPLSFDVPPTIINGRTLVPFREIFEGLGATLEWDGKTQTVVASKGLVKVQVTVGETEAFKNGKSVMLEVPAAVINGRTMVPLRFVSEAMGSIVDWEGASRTITIHSEPQIVPIDQTATPAAEAPPFIHPSGALL